MPIQLATTFIELVFKLNEASFKPLYRRLSDWAAGDEIDFSPQGDLHFARWRTFCYVLATLLDYFKVYIMLSPHRII